jgi:hypothetical protein
MKSRNFLACSDDARIARYFAAGDSLRSATPRMDDRSRSSGFQMPSPLLLASKLPEFGLPGRVEREAFVLLFSYLFS